MITNQLIAGDCRMLCEEHCSYEIRCLVSHPWVMVGRRRAVGFMQIVPGVFPTGVVTDRLRALTCRVNAVDVAEWGQVLRLKAG